jgi:hypothetical protein
MAEPAGSRCRVDIIHFGLTGVGYFGRMARRFPNVQFEDNPTVLINPILAFLLGYWQRKRGSRAMPSRANIRPSELREHLPWIVMVDVLPDRDEFRYRLIGTLVTQYFNTDATGRTIAEAWASQGEEGVQGVLSIMRYVVQHKFPTRVYGEADWNTIGLEKFDGIYLPLSDDGENVNLILHAFVFDRPEVLLARQIARNNGGDLLAVPKSAA